MFSLLFVSVLCSGLAPRDASNLRIAGALSSSSLVPRIAAVATGSLLCNREYYAHGDSVFYYLTIVQTPIEYRATDGHTYVLGVCTSASGDGSSSGAPAVCSPTEPAGVCQTDGDCGDPGCSFGQFSTAVFSDGVNGPDTGFVVTYTGGDAEGCPSGVQRQVEIQLNCNSLVNVLRISGPSDLGPCHIGFVIENNRLCPQRLSPSTTRSITPTKSTTSTETASQTPSESSSVSRTPSTSAVSQTPSQSESAAETPSPTSAPSETASATTSTTSAPSETASATGSATSAPSETASETRSNTNTATLTRTPSPSTTPTKSRSLLRTSSPSTTPSAVSSTPIPSVVLTHPASHSKTPEASKTAAKTPEASKSSPKSPSASKSAEASHSVTKSAEASKSPHHRRRRGHAA